MSSTQYTDFDFNQFETIESKDCIANEIYICKRENTFYIVRSVNNGEKMGCNNYIYFTIDNYKEGTISLTANVTSHSWDGYTRYKAPENIKQFFTDCIKAKKILDFNKYKALNELYPIY